MFSLRRIHPPVHYWLSASLDVVLLFSLSSSSLVYSGRLTEKALQWTCFSWLCIQEGHKIKASYKPIIILASLCPSPPSQSPAQSVHLHALFSDDVKRKELVCHFCVLLCTFSVYTFILFDNFQWYDILWCFRKFSLCYPYYYDKVCNALLSV